MGRKSVSGIAAGIKAKICNTLSHDENLIAGRRHIKRGGRGFGSWAKRYLIAKAPIVQWLPNYSPRWLLDDFIAGQSVGMLLVPQTLMFAQLAGAPATQGLISAWLPGLIYALMGTSKDISPGPTFTIAMLTQTIVKGITEHSSRLPPWYVTPVLAFGVGAWSCIFGFLNLGFIFDFISLPIMLGFNCGIGIIVITAQLPVLLGLEGIDNTFINQLPAVITHIPETKPQTIAIGLSSIALLALFAVAGHHWGSRSHVVRLLCNSRDIIVITAMTLLSYLLNRNLDSAHPHWAITGPTEVDIPPPLLPLKSLLKGLFFPSIMVFLAAALEHITIAKFMAHKNGYNLDTSQELVALGITNFAQSMMGSHTSGGMPVGGGDLARASVSSLSGSKSPLSNIITSVTVLVCMYIASPAAQWIPKSTIAAVTAVAVYENMPALKNMSKYWKISFLDFLGFLLSFNFTMINGPVQGLLLAVIIMIFLTLGRTLFSWPRHLTRYDLEQKFQTEPSSHWPQTFNIPEGTQVISMATNLIYMNAARVKRTILNTVYMNTSGNLQRSPKYMRSWNDRLEKDVNSLRRNAGFSQVDTYTPPLRVLVLDFSAVHFIDASGLQILSEIKEILRSYAGSGVEFRFVGVNYATLKKFERAGWGLKLAREFPTPPSTSGSGSTGSLSKIVTGMESVRGVDSNDMEGVLEPEKDLVFELLPTAIWYESRGTGDGLFIQKSF